MDEDDVLARASSGSDSDGGRQEANGGIVDALEAGHRPNLTRKYKKQRRLFKRSSLKTIDDHHQPRVSFQLAKEHRTESALLSSADKELRLRMGAEVTDATRINANVVAAADRSQWDVDGISDEPFQGLERSRKRGRTAQHYGGAGRGELVSRDVRSSSALLSSTAGDNSSPSEDAKSESLRWDRVLRLCNRRVPRFVPTNPRNEGEDVAALPSTATAELHQLVDDVLAM